MEMKDRQLQPTKENTTVVENDKEEIMPYESDSTQLYFVSYGAGSNLANSKKSNLKSNMVKPSSKSDIAKSNRMVLIFPFCYKGKKSFGTICRRADREFNCDDLVNMQTRLFDYIPGGMKEKKQDSEDGYIRTALCIDGPIEPLFDSLKNCIQTSDGRMQAKLMGDSIWFFKSRVGFFMLHYELVTPNSFREEEYFDLRQKLKVYGHTNEVAEFVLSSICSILHINKQDIGFFDSSINRDSKNRKKMHIKPAILSTLFYQKGKDPKASLIPLYGSGRTRIKGDMSHRSCLSENILCPPMSCDYTAEGCCAIFKITDKNVRSYLKSNHLYYYQHILFCYLLCLHQLYCVRVLTQSANCKTDDGYDKIWKEYIDFRRLHLFKRVSVKEEYHRLYTDMQEKMGIDSLLEEAQYTIEPLRKELERKTDLQQTVLLIIIGAVSIVPIMISIYDGFQLRNMIVLAVCILAALAVVFGKSLCNHIRSLFRKLIQKWKK